MKPPSTQTIGIAAASAAALATATTAAYHLYHNRRHDTNPNSKQFRETPQPDQLSLANVIALSVSCTIDVRASPDTNRNAQYSENSNSRLSSNSPRNLIHTRLTNIEEKPISTNGSFQWAVFWDIENVPIPRTTTASHFVKALRKTLAAHRDQAKPDAILRIHAIANIRRTSIRLRHHLQANGVNLTHVESKGRKDVADKALITEICLTTREYPTPFGICLISGDGDFSYAVSRLTTLGYDTVVIAPTAKRFSNLLAAVPDAVIPLSTVLEACHDPSSEPQAPLREKPQVRATNSQKQNPTQHAKQTLPVHTSRRTDRRVVRAKRRERVMLPSTGRDENDYRSSRKPAASCTQDDIPDSQVPPQSFDKSYTNRYETIAASPTRLIPLQHNQTQVKQAPRQKRTSQSPENVCANSFQPQSTTAARTVSEDATQPTFGKGMEVANAKTGNGGTQGRNGKSARSSAKVKATVIRRPNQGKHDPTAHVKQVKEADQRGSSNLRNKENGEWNKKSRRLGVTTPAEIPIGTEAVWVYNGARALPFLILFLVLLYSFVTKALVSH